MAQAATAEPTNLFNVATANTRSREHLRLKNDSLEAIATAGPASVIAPVVREDTATVDNAASSPVVLRAVTLNSYR